ncbi:MAG: WG repeat-containing protein, partial [Terriglobales bacterium]
MAAIVLTAMPVASAQQSSERRLPVEIDGKYGFIDASSHLVIAADFDLVWGFSEGLASAWRNEEAGYIDESGNFVIPPQFQYASAFSEGLAGVESGDKWGYVNQRGSLVIPPRYRQSQAFSEGLASVQTATGLWGFVDEDGVETITPRFTLAWSFSEHVAAVYHGEKCGFIDANGIVVVPFRFRAAMLHRTQQLRINPRQPSQGLRIQPIVLLSTLSDPPYVAG